MCKPFSVFDKKVLNNFNFLIEMSFHTITMVTRWALTADEDTIEILEQLRILSPEERKKSPILQKIVQNLFNHWRRENATRIERLATLGWKEYEVICMISEILDNWKKLKKEFRQQVRQYGQPAPLRDEDTEAYEQEIWKEIKSMNTQKE